MSFCDRSVWRIPIFMADVMTGHNEAWLSALNRRRILWPEGGLVTQKEPHRMRGGNEALTYREDTYSDGGERRLCPGRRSISDETGRAIV